MFLLRAIKKFPTIDFKRKLVIFVCFGQVFFVGAIENAHGCVVKVEPKENAIMEHVVLYPQESHDSLKKIARHGILARNNEAQATILICHGFMCDKYDVGMLRKIFKKKQFNVMTFDFRAHGQDSSGQYCTFGRDEALDVIAAAQFLRKHPDLEGKPLFAYGFSMGAVSAIEAQALAPTLFDAMILDCPFDSSERVIKTGLQGLKCSIFGYEFDVPGKDFLQRYAFHPYVQVLVKTVLKTVSQMDASGISTNFCPLYPSESVKNISIPLFFIHCKNDQKVSIDQVKKVYNGAAGYKRLWLTNGRRHYDSFFYNPEKYIQEVRQFYNQVINGEIASMPQELIVEDLNDDKYLL